MADTVSTEKRSEIMSHIRATNTAIEVRVRKELFRRGFRYRKNVKTLPGKPDIVLPKYHTVIFIHGCFWHRHEGCKIAHVPKSRVSFWEAKFQRNVDNDRKHKAELENMGWNVIVLWECEIEKKFDETIERVVNEIVEVE